MKRVFSIFLCIALSLGLAACAANSSTTEKPLTSNASSDSGGGAQAPDNGMEPIRFSVFHPDSARRIPPDDAPIVQQVYENTGVMLDWIIPPADPIERLNIMLATDDLPDLICFEDLNVPLGTLEIMMKQFIEAGKLLDIEDLMKENAPQAYNVNFEGFRDKIRYKDGKMYFLPYLYQFGDAADTRWFPETDLTFGARTGLLEDLGWYTPNTLDAVYELLKICKERYPDMSPMALALGPEGHLEFMNGIGAGAYGLTFEDSNILLYNDRIEYFSDVPEMKEWYAFLNKIHREGLLDIESPIMSADMLKEKLISGKIFSFFGACWEPSTEFKTYMMSNGSNEEVAWYFFPRANDGVKKTTYARYTQNLYTAGLTVTKDNKDPERFFKFYEYLNTEDGWYNSHGIVNWDFTGENTVEATEGYDYVVRNDVPQMREGLTLIEASQWQGASWESDENWWWNRGLENFMNFKYDVGNHPLGKYDQVGNCDVGMWWDENTTKINAQYGVTGLNFWEVMTSVGGDNTPIAKLTVEPGSDEAIAQITMEEYLKKQLPRIIVANSEDEFESLWNDMNSQLAADGKDKFIAKKRELYDQRLADWEK